MYGCTPIVVGCTGTGVLVRSPPWVIGGMIVPSRLLVRKMLAAILPFLKGLAAWKWGETERQNPIIT